MNRWPLLGLLAAAGIMAGAGCSTYHYYDVDVQWGPVGIEQAGVVQYCQLDVSGADSHQSHFPSSTVGDSKTVCPIAQNWPDMGTFEYASFADSGQMTFKVTGYKSLPANTASLCVTGTLTLNASSEITQKGTLTMGTFDDANCPTGIVRP